MASQPEEVKSKKFNFMIKTPEYHGNKIIEAEFGEDLESSVLTYAAETSEAEAKPEEILVTEGIKNEEKKRLSSALKLLNIMKTKSSRPNLKIFFKKEKIAI